MEQIFAIKAAFADSASRPRRSQSIIDCLTFHLLFSFISWRISSIARKVQSSQIDPFTNVCAAELPQIDWHQHFKAYRST